jgi:hypothetical protein
LSITRVLDDIGQNTLVGMRDSHTANMCSTWSCFQPE